MRHSFEAAHRLSCETAPTKCQSIHGHSYTVTVTIASAQLDNRGMVVEFGDFKRRWQPFIEQRICHHLIVSDDDALLGAIRAIQPEARILELPYQPTTENIARWLYQRARELLTEIAHGARRVRVISVHLQETGVNTAEYRPQQPAEVAEGD